MTKAQTARLMALIAVYYPRFYPDQTQQQQEAITAAWYAALEKYPENLVTQALQWHVTNSVYPPTVADICKRVKAVRGVNAPNADDLWHMIYKAASRAGYHAQEEYANLPEPCKRFIGSAAALHRMALMDETTLNTVTRGQWLRRADALIEQDELLRMEAGRQAAIGGAFIEVVVNG